MGSSDKKLAEKWLKICERAKNKEFEKTIEK